MTNGKKKAAAVALIVVGVASLLLAGGLVAGNMGFRLTNPMDAQGTSPSALSKSGQNYIGLPYRHKQSLVTARDLFIDIGVGSTQLISQHRRNDDLFNVYTFGGGNIPPNGWNLVPGEGYIVKLGADTNYNIIGTHEPDLSFTLLGGDHAQSLSGQNYFAPPYHSVAANARDLFLEIGGNVSLISQHNRANDLFNVYTFGGGNLPPNGWNLVAGEMYIVKVGGISQVYHPLHY